MRAVCTVGQVTWRKASGQLIRQTTSRGFRSTSALPATQNFTMPAMSPTMTEGNIASWKVKEGDSFSTGDVLLEIETDKAQMDVEAQDDGIMAKITQGDGSKAVKVGTRIAVLAEPDDDIKTLEIPAEDTTAKPSPQEKPESSAKTSKSSESSPGSPLLANTPSESPKSGSNSKTTPTPSKKPTIQPYPLYPSVEHLLHQNGLSASDADKIPPSGPQGRLLKGDVLAYLGSISSSYPSELSTRLSKLEHLDLSNIIIPPQAPKAEAEVAKGLPQQPAPPQEKDVKLTVSLAAVLTVQKRIQDTIGFHMPLSSFVARAIEVANDNLPRSQSTLTPDELFDSVLGLDKTSSISRGRFVPKITASSLANVQKKPLAKTEKSDILDILSGSPKTRAVKASTSIDSTTSGTKTVSNVFTVTVPPGDERRGRVFLERVKTILEIEPGRLVI